MYYNEDLLIIITLKLLLFFNVIIEICKRLC